MEYGLKKWSSLGLHALVSRPLMFRILSKSVIMYLEQTIRPYFSKFLSSSNVCLIFSSVASTTSPPVLPCPDGGNPGSSLVTTSNSNMPSTVKTTITATAGVTAGLPNSNRYISTPYLLGLIPTYKLRHMTKFKSPFTLCIVCLLPTIARVKLHRKGDYLHVDALFSIYSKRLRCFPTSGILIFLRLCFF